MHYKTQGNNSQGVSWGMADVDVCTVGKEEGVGKGCNGLKDLLPDAEPRWTQNKCNYGTDNNVTDHVVVSSLGKLNTSQHSRSAYTAKLNSTCSSINWVIRISSLRINFIYFQVIHTDILWLIILSCIPSVCLQDNHTYIKLCSCSKHHFIAQFNSLSGHIFYAPFLMLLPPSFPHAPAQILSQQFIFTMKSCSCFSTWFAVSWFTMCMRTINIEGGGRVVKFHLVRNLIGDALNSFVGVRNEHQYFCT